MIFDRPINSRDFDYKEVSNTSVLEDKATVIGNLLDKITVNNKRKRELYCTNLKFFRILYDKIDFNRLTDITSARKHLKEVFNDIKHINGQWNKVNKFKVLNNGSSTEGGYVEFDKSSGVLTISVKDLTSKRTWIHELAHTCQKLSGSCNYSPSLTGESYYSSYAEIEAYLLDAYLTEEDKLYENIYALTLDRTPLYDINSLFRNIPEDKSHIFKFYNKLVKEL